MTQNKLHRIIPFLILVSCLMCCLHTEAQRARNRRRGIIDTVRVDTLGTDSVSLDTITGKKKQPLDAPVTFEANDSSVFTEGGFAHL